jgi:hypothetical protein
MEKLFCFSYFCEIIFRSVPHKNVTHAHYIRISFETKMLPFQNIIKQLKDNVICDKVFFWLSNIYSDFFF